MDLIAQIQSLVQEAELYRTQGLLREAQVRFGKVLALLQEHGGIGNRQALMEKIGAKLADLAVQITKLDSEPVAPQMSKETQDLIRKLFTDGKNMDRDAQSLEGAIVMAKFGQFDRALQEFDQLVAKDSLRVVAAKNILRCHLAAGLSSEAVRQYDKWRRDDDFPTQQLEKIRFFLNGLLRKKGDAVPLTPRADLPAEKPSDVKIELSAPNQPSPAQTPAPLTAQAPRKGAPRQAAPPAAPARVEGAAPPSPPHDQHPSSAPLRPAAPVLEPSSPPRPSPPVRPAPTALPDHAPQTETEDDMIDINAVLIGFTEGPLEGKKLELDVSFQLGNVVSLMVPDTEKDLVGSLPVGRKFGDVQFFSPIAIFQGRGEVIGSTRIESGPRRGSFNIDLKVTSA